MYQLAELHRLRGETDEAEAAYRQASECGHYPQPGLALLRVAQGRVDAAAAAIRGAADEVTDRLGPGPLLAGRASRSCSPPATSAPRGPRPTS